jgi:hypothetical protein
MNKVCGTLYGIVAGALCAVAVPAQPQDTGAPNQGAVEPRELIYCADLMTHEEREAYRARMRAARTSQEKAAVRDAHRQEMQARARERGVDPLQCEPLRLRQRGGKSP